MVTVMTQIFALLTIMGQIALAGAIISFLFARKQMPHWPVYRYIAARSTLIALLLATGAMLGSLFYSEIARFEPCLLCWWQRIFMYPQALLLGIALWKKDHRVWQYILPMSAAGAAISAYHYYVQLGGQPLIPCSVVGYSVSCSKRFVLQYGFVSIPLMALVIFLLIIVLMLIKKQEERSNSFIHLK